MQQFKVGDWVRIGCKKSLAQIKTCTENYINAGGINIHKPSVYWDTVELWQPKVGEWCWFMFSKNDRPFIDQFSHIEEKFILGSTIIKPAYHTIGGTLGKAFCEPFIGELPTFLKEHNNDTNSNL